MNKAITDCLSRINGPTPNIHSIAVALALIASACGNDSSLIQRFVSAFIQGQGIASFPGGDEAIDALIADGVLMKSKIKLRSTQPQYVLDERFRGSFGTLQLALVSNAIEAPEP